MQLIELISGSFLRNAIFITHFIAVISPTSSDFITRRGSDKSLWDISVAIYVRAECYLLTISAKVLTWKRYVMETCSALLGLFDRSPRVRDGLSSQRANEFELRCSCCFRKQTVAKIRDLAVISNALTLMRLKCNAPLWHDFISFWML